MKQLTSNSTKKRKRKEEAIKAIESDQSGNPNYKVMWSVSRL